MFIEQFVVIQLVNKFPVFMKPASLSPFDSIGLFRVWRMVYVLRIPSTPCQCYKTQTEIRISWWPKVAQCLDWDYHFDVCRV